MIGKAPRTDARRSWLRPRRTRVVAGQEGRRFAGGGGLLARRDRSGHAPGGAVRRDRQGAGFGEVGVEARPEWYDLYARIYRVAIDLGDPRHDSGPRQPARRGQAAPPRGGPHAPGRRDRDRTLIRSLVQDLLAQIQAFIADPQVTGRCHGRNPVAGLAAEGALFRPRSIAYLLDRGDGRAGRAAWLGYYLPRAAHAPVADIHVQPAADDRPDLLSPRSAERARHTVSGIRHSPTVSRRERPFPRLAQ